MRSAPAGQWVTSAGTSRSRYGRAWCSWRATTSARSRAPLTTRIWRSSVTACSSSRAVPRRWRSVPESSQSANGGARSALLIDWGGVLTSNLFVSFNAHCVASGIEPETLRERFRGDSAARELLIALEKGQLDEAAFELQFATQLGVAPDGLIDGLFAGVQPDVAMVQAVRRARQAGVRTALVSNSWGGGISGEGGIGKPSRRMYELGAERAGVAPEACVFVDDLEFNLKPAQDMGMATVHHTSAEISIPELERILGVSLGG